jgi:hypothetical protein
MACIAVGGASIAVTAITASIRETRMVAVVGAAPTVGFAFAPRHFSHPTQSTSGFSYSFVVARIMLFYLRA